MESEGPDNSELGCRLVCEFGGDFVFFTELYAGAEDEDPSGGLVLGREGRGILFENLFVLAVEEGVVEVKEL